MLVISLPDNLNHFPQTISGGILLQGLPIHVADQLSQQICTVCTNHQLNGMKQ